MVIDHIKNRERYFSLGSGIERALRYLAVTDFSEIKPGRVEIDGDKIFAIVDEYTPGKPDECMLEAHKHYVDVQFLVHGRELVGYAPLCDQEPAKPYSAENDIAFYDGEEAYFELNTSMFCILYPEDLHKPGLENVPGTVKKVVVKAALSTLKCVQSDK